MQDPTLRGYEMHGSRAAPTSHGAWYQEYETTKYKETATVRRKTGRWRVKERVYGGVDEKVDR